jgi:hypothetical protein
MQHYQAMILQRRTLLKWMSATGAGLALPALHGCSNGSDHAVEVPAANFNHFFTPQQRAIVDALAGTLIPEDATVGAVKAGAVEYIDRYLAAFTLPVPDIFRGGPYSGREPFPDPVTGAASNNFPENNFEQVLPMSRMLELAYRRQFFGSAAIPNGTINEPYIANWPGMHALYQQALQQLMDVVAAAGVGSFAALDETRQLEAFDATDPEFRALLIEHLAEGMFSAPEYGGNAERIAWRDYYYDGDSQPLGHTLYDSVTDTLYDRADAPNQSIDEDAFNDPMSEAVLQFVSTITLGQGGTRFF